MTRAEFEARAIRAAERALGVPPGWHGVYGDVRGPGSSGEVRVRRDRHSYWALYRAGGRGSWLLVSRHDSRSHAINKARRLP